MNGGDHVNTWVIMLWMSFTYFTSFYLLVTFMLLLRMVAHLVLTSFSFVIMYVTGFYTLPCILKFYREESVMTYLLSPSKIKYSFYFLWEFICFLAVCSNGWFLHYSDWHEYHLFWFTVAIKYSALYITVFIVDRIRKHCWIFSKVIASNNPGRTIPPP